MSRIKVMLLDNQNVAKACLQSFFQLQSDVEVLGSFDRLVDLVSAMRKQMPDVALLDFSLSNEQMDGLSLIQSMAFEFPGCKILVISAFDIPALNPLLKRVGADGYINKSASADEIMQVLRAVACGDSYWSEFENVGKDKEVMPSCDGPKLDFLFGELSPREKEVIRCYLKGMTVSEIAKKFTRSVKTISAQKTTAFKKMGVKTDKELFLLVEGM